MKTSIQSLIEAAQKKMSGYAALYNYRLMNLCVKASPESLLPVEVQLGGEPAHLEDVSRVRNAPDREDQFEIYPLDKDYLYPILRGMHDVHPEFIVEVKQFGDSDADDEESRYILATMPPVEDARHQVLMDAVGVLSDECDAKIKATFDYYTGQISFKLATAPAEEMDEAKNALQEVHDSHADLCKQFRANKEQEIEDAYQQFLADKAALQAKLQEEADAHNEQVAQQMKWTPDDE